MTARLRIVAIGGGDLRALETLAIDRRIVELTGKARPKALFLPTASGDSDDYVDAFEQVYGARLGCQTSHLKVVRNAPSARAMAAAVLGADLVYVGGGNTLRMMRAWRRVGLDRVLRRAASRGVVLSGLSAGAICWFACGHSDSRRFAGRADWRYIRVRGLGLIDALFCPHYHAEGREQELASMVARVGGCAIACNDGAAVEIQGRRYRVLAAWPSGKAYRVGARQGEVVAEPLPADGRFRPLPELLAGPT